MESVEAQIFRYARQNPSKVALISGKSIVTYDQLISNIFFTKSLLQDTYKLKKGKIVVLSAAKTPGFVYTYFALHLIGAPVVILETDSAATKISFIEEKLNPFYYFGPFKYYEGDNIVKNFFELSESLEPGDVLLKGYNQEDCFLVNNNDTADILFTTGTTGTPKGIKLSNANIAAAVENINSFIQNSDKDVELLALPVSHSFGLGRIRCVLTKGGTIILYNGFTNVKKFFQTILELRVTGFAMVPSAWQYLQKMSGAKLSEFSDQLKYIEIGSAPMTASEKMYLKTLLPNTRICMHYGLTEASRSLFLLFSDDSKLSTIGRAAPNVDVKIIDENNNFMQDNEVGEIVVSGGHVCQSFVDQSFNINEQFVGNYLKTGDLGTIDNEGFITLVGRSKEMINIGGKKASPLEIEALINTVSGIVESACIGVPDTDNILGEKIKVFLVGDGKSETIDKIKELLHQQLESYKFPSQYEWIDQIPKTESGKIQRLKLK